MLDKSFKLRESIVRVLRVVSDQRIVDAQFMILNKFDHDPNDYDFWSLWIQVAENLIDRKESRATPSIFHGLRNEKVHWSCRHRAVQLIRRCILYGFCNVFDVFKKLLTDTDITVRWTATCSLAEVGDPNAMRNLIEFSKDNFKACECVALIENILQVNGAIVSDELLCCIYRLENIYGISGTRWYDEGGCHNDQRNAPLSTHKIRELAGAELLRRGKMLGSNDNFVR
jgi:hypothetical protein